MHRESGSILATPGVATLHIAYFSSSFNSRIIEAKSPGNGFSARVPHFLAMARFFSTNFALQGRLSFRDYSFPSRLLCLLRSSLIFVLYVSRSRVCRIAETRVSGSTVDVDASVSGIAGFSHRSRNRTALNSRAR